ncbi:hypothetical protein ACHAPO_011547 [Fusarium lateritium]
MIEKISGLNSDKKPSRSSHGYPLKGEVFIDLRCDDASNPAFSSNNGRPPTDVTNNAQTPQDVPHRDETLPYREAYTPEVVGFDGGHPNVHDYPSYPNLVDPSAQTGYSNLLPDEMVLSGFMPDTFYVEDTSQICNPMTDMTTFTWDQFQMPCQEDYSMSVPWSLELDFEGLTAAELGTCREGPY